MLNGRQMSTGENKSCDDNFFPINNQVTVD